MISQNAMFRSKIEPIRFQNWFKHDKNDKKWSNLSQNGTKKAKIWF